MSAYQETQVHGTHGFPYIVYPGILPEYISGIPHHWHEEMEIISSLLYYSPISGERKDRLLIGIARDKSSAFELARYLTEKMYNELRRVDFKAFYGEMFKRER